MYRIGNLIIGNYDISSSTMGVIDMAKAITEFIDTKNVPVTFLITAKAGGRVLVYGYLYSNKLHGAFVFVPSSGNISTVALNEGIYKQIGA